jgi:hypothetical protein
MTRMTGMTRNMKTSSDTGTANKVPEKLSFLSFLSWDVEIKQIHCYCQILNLINIFLIKDMLSVIDEKINLSIVSFDTNQLK